MGLASKQCMKFVREVRWWGENCRPRRNIRFGRRRKKDGGHVIGGKMVAGTQERKFPRPAYTSLAKGSPMAGRWMGMKWRLGADKVMEERAGAACGVRLRDTEAGVERRRIRRGCEVAH